MSKILTSIHVLILIAGICVGLLFLAVLLVIAIFLLIGWLLAELWEILWKAIVGDALPDWVNSLVYILLWVSLFWLTSCHPKPKPAPAPPITILADTTRLQLKRQVDLSGNVLIEISQKTDSTLTEHEKVVQRYDSIQISLP